MKKVLAIIICASMMVSMVACGGKTEATNSEKEDSSSKNLIVYSPHPLEFIDPIVAEFESEQENY